MVFYRFMSLQTLSADGFWAAEVNFLVCRLRPFARALQSPTSAMSPVYGATDIPTVVRLQTQSTNPAAGFPSVPELCAFGAGCG